MSLHQILKIKKILNIIYILVITGAALVVARYILLLVAYDTFHTPTRSMTPTLPPGYHGVVNKVKLGGRIFDFIAAAKGEPFTVRRLPGYGHLEKNDIIVFNAPWTDSWDSIAMNMRLYYCKRVVATAGDTLEIDEGIYKVRGFDEPLGVVSEQQRVKPYVDHFRRITPDSVRMEGSVYSIPYDSILGWTIDRMGPLVVPAKNMTVNLDRENFLIYRKYIEWETGKKLSLNSDGTVLIQKDGRDTALPIKEYTFSENYCFTAGDHAVDSQDSRYWGFLPEKFIVGTVFL